MPPETKPEITNIRVKFGTTIVKIGKIFANCGTVSVADLKEFLKCSYPHLVVEANGCSTVQEIFALICRKQCTLIDISILESLVNNLEVIDAKTHIDSYKSTIAKFCTNICISLALEQRFKVPDHSTPLQCETATFVLDWNPDNYTIDDARCLLSDAFERLSINVKVEVIGKGNSIIITCSFPFDLTGLLIAKATSNLKQLKKKGLLKLTIGYCTIWSRDMVHKL